MMSFERIPERPKDSLKKSQQNNQVDSHQEEKKETEVVQSIQVVEHNYSDA